MNSTHSVAVAIVIGFALVAISLYLTLGIGKVGIGDNSPMREDFHIRKGDPKAEITIVEFSDIECPFCARLHPVLSRIVEESEGRIQWEYRHLPLAIHTNARTSAHASECVAEISGEEIFWEYLDILYRNQVNLSTSFLSETAKNLGVDGDEFNRCINEEFIHERIRNDEQVAKQFGGNGTPFSIIVFSDGSIKPVSGALPYEQWKTLLQL